MATHLTPTSITLDEQLVYTLNHLRELTSTAKRAINRLQRISKSHSTVVDYGLADRRRA